MNKWKYECLVKFSVARVSCDAARCSLSPALAVSMLRSCSPRLKESINRHGNVTWISFRWFIKSDLASARIRLTFFISILRHERFLSLSLYRVYSCVAFACLIFSQFRDPFEVRHKRSDYHISIYIRHIREHRIQFFIRSYVYIFDRPNILN